jgi:hypothetical protein
MMEAAYEMFRDALTPSRLRLGRARKRFMALGEEITAFVRENGPELDRRFDPVAGWTSYHLKHHRQPSKQFAEGAGLVCEDLRSALDLLIAGLRTTPTSDPSRFPVCLTADEYFGDASPRASRRRLLKGLASPDLALIDSLQPFHRVNPAQHPLARLQATYEAYTRDELRSVLVFSDLTNVEMEELEPNLVKRVEARSPDSGVLAREDLEAFAYRVWPDPAARLKVDLSLRFDLRFDPPGLTMSDLDRVRMEVENAVRGFDTRLGQAA